MTDRTYAMEPCKTALAVTAEAALLAVALKYDPELLAKVLAALKETGK
jgi:hypothetical protein